MQTVTIEHQVTALRDEQRATETPYDCLARKEDIDTLDSLLNDIPEREAMLLRLRYGLNDNEAMALSRIGRKFGVTGERVRQLNKSALKRLRRRWG